jgi:hypothetical protein
MDIGGRLPEDVSDERLPEKDSGGRSPGRNMRRKPLVAGHRREVTGEISGVRSPEKEEVFMRLLES